MSARAMLQAGTLFATLALVVVALNVTGLADAVDQSWIDTHVRGQGAAGVALFIAMGGLFTAVGLPRQLIGFLGGYAFGAVAGTAIGALAAGVGCMTTFFYARFLGRDLVTRRFSQRVQRIDRFLADNPFAMTLLIRFLPVGSNLGTNLAAGVSSVAAPPFILGSVLGYIPQTLIAALIGEGIEADPVFNLTCAAGLFAISSALGLHLYKKYRRGRSIAPAVNGT